MSAIEVRGGATAEELAALLAALASGGRDACELEGGYARWRRERRRVLARRFLARR